MSWTLTTSGAAIDKAGANANTTIIASTARLANWSDQAEAFLSLRTRYDWVKNFSTVKTNLKPLLNDAVSDLIAIKIINYNLNNYPVKTQAQVMLNVLTDNYSKIIADLKEKENQGSKVFT